MYYFSNLDDVLLAYTQNKIGLHAYVWVRFNDSVKDDGKLIKIQSSAEGTTLKIYNSRIVKEDSSGKCIVPDAFEVVMTLTDMVMPSRNLFQHTWDSDVKATVI